MQRITPATAKAMKPPTPNKIIAAKIKLSCTCFLNIIEKQNIKTENKMTIQPKK